MLQDWGERPLRLSEQRRSTFKILSEVTGLGIAGALWMIHIAMACLVFSALAHGQTVTTCTIISNHDGDTLTANCSGIRRHLRLSSVDAPEQKQTYGDDAQQFTERLTLDKTVVITIHDIDKYGRTVAAVTLPNGRDLARELVHAGLAWHYVRYSRDPLLAELEVAAHAAHRGLWAQTVPESPSAFRHALARSGTNMNEMAKRGRIRRSEQRSERRTLVAGR